MKRSLLLVLMMTSALAAAEMDLSTPKSAATSLFNAINAGDPDAVRAALDATDPQQAELASAMAELIVAGKKLGDAAHAQFGSAADPIGRGMLDPEDLKRLGEAKISETGDSAVISVPGQPRPMSFHRRDGKWRLVITNLEDATPLNIVKQAKLVRMLADAMNAAAADISVGTYRTPEAAVNAIQQRLHGVMLTFHRPSTTRAATTTTAPLP